MALIIAGIIAAVTVAIVVVTIAADGMSDSPTTVISPIPAAVIGFGLAALIAASHWFPHISW